METMSGSSESGSRGLADWKGWRATAILSSMAAVCGLVAGSAVAGDWTLTDSQTVAITAVDRSGADGYTGNVFQFSPQVRLVGSGGRSSADVNYRLTMSTGFGGADPRPFGHDLLARGNVEVVEDFFFLGARAGARMSGTSLGSTPVDSINFNTDSGRQSFSLGIDPEFRAHVNRYVDFVSRNAVDFVTYSDDSQGGNNDSQSVTLHAGVRNTRHYGPLSWSADARHRETSYDDRDDTRSEVTAGAGYRISPQWRVRGSVGYEDNDVDTSRSTTNGTIWDIGGDWTPNPRTKVSATFGSRYYGNTYSARLDHRMKRSRLALDLSQSVENRRTTELVDSYFYLVDSNGQIVVDPNTGNPIIANIPETQLTNEDYVSTRLRGIWTFTGRRTNVKVTGTVENRDYEVSPISEDSYELSADVSRRLGSHYRVTLGADYYYRDRDNAGDEDTYDVRFSLSRQFSTRTSASIDLLHRDYSSSASSNDYTENRVGISLTSSFL